MITLVDIEARNNDKLRDIAKDHHVDPDSLYELNKDYISGLKNIAKEKALGTKLRAGTLVQVPVSVPPPPPPLPEQQQEQNDDFNEEEDYDAQVHVSKKRKTSKKRM